MKKQNIQRRSFLKRTSIIASAAIAAPTALISCSDDDNEDLITPTLQYGQGDGFYRKKIGNKEITVISDGSLYFPNSFFAQEADETSLNQLTTSNGFSSDTTAVQVNAMVIKENDDITLIDVGTSEGIYDTVGNFLRNFHKAGFKEKDVNRVILTHLHFDHFGYLFDKEGKAIFPNAEIILSEKEYNFWNDNTIDLSNINVDQGTKDFFINSAKTVINNMKNQFTVKKGGQELAPGLAMLEAPGHTPGHFAIEGDGFVYLADTFVHPWVHLPHPEWTSKVDVNPDAVRSSRKMILDKVATDNLLVAGSHTNFPGFGRILKNGNGYDWKSTPFEWK
ncbi:MBL fold metallo-hydrolase [Tenacibaculum sp. C7A-26P2]|uniref:MBL fold metallo-hydrolase n=1 Tax=Tenacibaculum sp. C7A-26P2 TaxID=3447504 RepID=UPI003F835EB0